MVGGFKGLLRGKSEASRIIRRAGKTGSLPILSPAGTLRMGETCWQAAPCTLLFMWTLILLTLKERFDHRWLLETLVLVGVVIGMLWPTTACVVYTAGCYKTIRSSVARSSAVVFWMYWPFCRFISCLAAVLISTTVANHIWFNNFRLYIEYQHLQAYDNVDTYTVTGNRMQDAGLVVFNSTNMVDRSKGACLKGDHTYCIAPIVQGGELERFKQQNRVGINDIFMAGIDCCNCPMTDFRCGDWNDPRAPIGGMRLLDEDQRKFYRIAMEKWDVDFNKVSTHGIFFHWTNDPVGAWKELWTRGFHLLTLASVFGIFGPFLWMIILNGLMKFLRDHQIAAPLDDFLPETSSITLYGTDSTAMMPDQKSFIPDQYRSYTTQMEPKDLDPDPPFVIL